MAAYDITALGSKIEFDTTGATSMCSAAFPTKPNWFVVSWRQGTAPTYVQIFSYNSGTGNLDAIGSPLNTGAAATTTQLGTCPTVIDESNVMVVYSGFGSDGYAQLVSVDGSGNCSLNGSAYEFDTSSGVSPTVSLWDSTHVIVAWTGFSTRIKVQILSFNTGTGAISTVGTPLSTGYRNLSSIKKLDADYAIHIYVDSGDDAWLTVLYVNPSTYAVSTIGTPYKYLVPVGANDTQRVDVEVIDTSGSPYVVAAFGGVESTGELQTVRTFNINTTTWAVTAFGSALSLTTDSATSLSRSNRNLSKVDDATLVTLYRNGSDYATVSSISYDSGTGALAVISTVTLDNAAPNATYRQLTTVYMGNGVIGNAWTGADEDGFMQAVGIEIPTAVFTPSPMPNFIAE